MPGSDMLEKFRWGVATAAERFVKLIPLPDDYRAEARRHLVALIWAPGAPEDSARLDRFLPPGMPGPSREVRADLNAAIRSTWALRAFEERYGTQEEVR